jgi:hypothetical protein
LRNGVFITIAGPLYLRLRRLKENVIVYGQFTPMILFVKDDNRSRGSGIRGRVSTARCLGIRDRGSLVKFAPLVFFEEFNRAGRIKGKDTRKEDRGNRKEV